MTRDGGRSHPGQISLVKQANEMMIEIHFADALGHLVESYHLPHKGPSNKAFSALPFDVSTVAHPPCLPRARLFYFWQLLRQSAAHSGIALVGQERHPKHIATEKIAHCQRLAAPSIARAKPAFEVDCPHLVAAFYCVYSPPWQHRSAPRPALALLHQMQLHQPARQGAHRRNAPGLRESSSEQPSQLFCSPTRMLLAQFAQPHSPNKMVHFPSVARQARRIPQSFQSSGSITLPPLVTAL